MKRRKRQWRGKISQAGRKGCQGREREGREQNSYYRRGSGTESVCPLEGGKTTGGVGAKKVPEVGETGHYMVYTE